LSPKFIDEQGTSAGPSTQIAGKNALNYAPDGRAEKAMETEKEGEEGRLQIDILVGRSFLAATRRRELGCSE
jgi:hypothetical protein